jgi:hypothetical protein
MLVFCLAYSPSLKMKATYSFQKSAEFHGLRLIKLRLLLISAILYHNNDCSQFVSFHKYE